ncbi:MAG: hypothetical protein EVA70_01585 [Parvularculaceae bacterium]|nr:MAG: hypothetical protein EVA70_01585 [Parvularculaceae bacterium]
MLKSIKKGLTKTIVFVVGGLIILSFAITGVPGPQNIAQRSALKVGDKVYSANELQREFNREVQNRRLQSDTAYTQADAIREGVPLLVLANLRTRATLEQASTSLGLTIPRSVVRDFLNSDERFQNPSSGKFDYQTLNAIVQQYNISVQQFEELMRVDLLRSQLVSSLTGAAPAPTAFADPFSLREIEERQISYVVVTPENAGDGKEPTEEDLRAFHADNPATFTRPELRTFTALILSKEMFQNDDAASEEKLREIYDANRERQYEQAETRTIYQVTFDNEGQAAAARAKLAQGEEFSAIATERGLSLDAVTFTDIAKTDVLDPNVAAAAFSEDASLDDVIGPIDGTFGYTIVKIVDITEERIQTFDDVKDEIRDQLLASDTRRMIYEAVESVENERDKGAGLIDAAFAAGLDAKTFGPIDSFSFGAGGEIIADVPGKVLAEAFLLDEGEQSEAVELADDGGYFFVAVDTITPAALQPFEDVQPKVETAWRRDEIRRRVDTAVEKLAATARETSLSDGAAQIGAEAINETISRRSTEIIALSAELSDKVFTASVGDVVSGNAGNGQAKAVVVVEDVKLDPARAAQDQVQIMRQYLGFQLDQELIDAYISAVQQDLGVKTNQEEIDTVFSSVNL